MLLVPREGLLTLDILRVLTLGNLVSHFKVEKITLYINKHCGSYLAIYEISGTDWTKSTINETYYSYVKVLSASHFKSETYSKNKLGLINVPVRQIKQRVRVLEKIMNI